MAANLHAHLPNLIITLAQTDQARIPAALITMFVAHDKTTAGVYDHSIVHGSCFKATGEKSNYSKEYKHSYGENYEHVRRKRNAFVC